MVSNPTQSTQPVVVMSGMRPTGRLHLGHYMGVLQNWVSLQHQHPCFFMVADWHALTTKLTDSATMKEHVVQMAMDWLAAGLEPEKCTVFVQSWVPEIAQIHLLLSMLTPNKWVETDPTLKEMVAMMRAGESGETELTYGLLGYPVLQTADILSMGGTHVPVGKDQEAHLEISRQIARRFNRDTAANTGGEPVFIEPRPMFTETPLLKGLDGRKMGKSYNNAIFLSDTEDETLAKLKAAVTDPQRVKRQDPGNPSQCVGVFPLYPVFAGAKATAQAQAECQSAARGCMDCKKQLAEAINQSLKPLRERRQLLEADPAQVEQLLRNGTEKARQVAAETLIKTRNALGLFN